MVEDENNLVFVLIGELYFFKGKEVQKTFFTLISNLSINELGMILQMKLKVLQLLEKLPCLVPSPLILLGYLASVAQY